MKEVEGGIEGGVGDKGEAEMTKEVLSPPAAAPSQGTATATTSIFFKGSVLRSGREGGKGKKERWMCGGGGGGRRRGKGKEE